MAGDEIITSIRYFLQFSYYPTFDEVYTFVTKRRAESYVQSFLKKQAKKGLICELDCGDSTTRYTLGGYSNEIKRVKKKIAVSYVKKQKITHFIHIARLIPWVQFVGISGSVAMNNAGAGDDIDLFVIARTHRMFTARFWLILAAFILGQKRPKNASRNEVDDKICLNLFFDESDLKVPKNKQNIYGGHEVLQLKPIINKNFIYERFLSANKWVFKLFPNAAAPDKKSGRQVLLNRSFLGDIIETILKQLQMLKINRGKTTEMITDTQLWFFPDDYEKKINY